MLYSGVPNIGTGSDVTVYALPAHGGLLLEGGVSAGKTMTDDCDVVAKLDNPTTLCIVTSRRRSSSTAGWMASHRLPWRARIAATFESSPGLGDGSGISATYLYSELPGLGRVTSAASGVTSVNLIPPGTRLGDRVNQINLRLARPFGIGHGEVEIRLDVYNALNAGTVLTWNNTYGLTAPSLTWLSPESITQGRIIELGVHTSW